MKKMDIERGINKIMLEHAIAEMKVLNLRLDKVLKSLERASETRVDTSIVLGIKPTSNERIALNTRSPELDSVKEHENREADAVGFNHSRE